MFGIDYNSPIVDLANFDVSDLVSALGFGGAMVLIGMATVFAVLILLWVCLVLFKVFFHDIPERKAKAPEAATLVPVQETVTAQPKDTEIIAVLAAAIAMAESESGGAKFNVVSFKRK